MGATKRIETQGTLSRLFLVGAIISGGVAAFLMYRRGETLGAIARKTVANPFGALASEVKTSFESYLPQKERDLLGSI
jgi:hypothetical protein